jgi:hypothetical protein
MTRDFERGVWAAFTHVLNWINTQEENTFQRSKLYAAVMSMRPTDVAPTNVSEVPD